MSEIAASEPERQPVQGLRVGPDWADTGVDNFDRGECFNAFCGYDEDHGHGPECTTECPCGRGEVEL